MMVESTVKVAGQRPGALGVLQGDSLTIAGVIREPEHKRMICIGIAFGEKEVAVIMSLDEARVIAQRILQKCDAGDWVEA